MNTTYPNSGKPWDDAQRQQVIDLHRTGTALDTIAELVGRKPHTIKQQLKAAGIVGAHHCWRYKTVTPAPESSAPVKPPAPVRPPKRLGTDQYELQGKRYNFCLTGDDSDLCGGDSERDEPL